MTSDESPVDRRMRLQKVLAELQDFMKTKAYAHYVDSRLAEVENLRAEIVDFEPTDRKQEIESYKLRGDLRTTREFVALFEDTATSLKTTIDDLIDAEQPSSTQQINNED